MKESEKSPVHYCVGSIMGSTSLIYQKIQNMEGITNKEEILKIVEEGIHKIDGELKKISNYLEEGEK
ncbi:hypothetical protein KAR91_15720 [Candidatus Pacearchaeota archaeon]|nr:hypothetical protein [Candidatus Pacearchaeota archaeon]